MSGNGPDNLRLVEEICGFRGGSEEPASWDTTKDWGMNTRNLLAITAMAILFGATREKRGRRGRWGFWELVTDTPTDYMVSNTNTNKYKNYNEFM